MKLVIEFDPWDESVTATRAAEALTTLGIPAVIRAIRPTCAQEADTSPVIFEPAQG